jgi:hypothetical protein
MKGSHQVKPQEKPVDNRFADNIKREALRQVKPTMMAKSVYEDPSMHSSLLSSNAKGFARREKGFDNQTVIV